MEPVYGAPPLPLPLPQDCYCPSPSWTAQQEAFAVPDYAPYYAPTEYPYACPAEEDYFRRELMSSEMCYNVL